MNKIKVLLIEDDRSISNFITATMDREGYKIMHALNGREGLSLSTSFCPNVILLDLGLPDMDGLEAVSYTHLDVYKRKLHRLPVPGARPGTASWVRISRLSCLRCV